MTPKELRAGRYVLFRTLGEGSQGETYDAVDRGVAPKPSPRDGEDLATRWSRYVAHARSGLPLVTKGSVDRGVAIKCFRLGRARAWKDVELAEREARFLASVEHPRLPRYIDHFEEDGALYLVMEKIEGESVAELRKRRRAFSADEVTRMLEDIAEALAYLHGLAPPVVHRDIKPGNVIRRPDGSYALVDFGAVRDSLKPSGGSTIVGTFGFMAPEQFQGRASPASDVYGLGATAIAMLTGMQPEDLPHQGLAIDVRRALPAATPRALVEALSAMLVPDPDRRVASVGEAVALLRRGAQERAPASGRLPQEEPPPGRRARRKLAQERRKTDRVERKRRREAMRRSRAPLVPRLLGKLGLLVASLVVWLAVGVVTPLVLLVLSLFFGGPLRRAASASARAATRARAAMRRASGWLSGERANEATADAAEGARVRVDASAAPARRRIADEAPAPDGEEPLEDAEPASSRAKRRLRRT